MKKIKRLLSAILVCVILLSACTAVSFSASPVSDGFFTGAATVVSLLSKSHPVVAVISSGLLGAYKTFYNDSAKVPEPSNQDIVNLLNDLNNKIDSHYNAQSSQIKELANINKLQRFSDILTSVKGYNEEAMTQLALYKEDKVCAQDYQNIINSTTGNSSFTKDFKDLSNLIVDGQSGLKGMPSFDQYLELSKSSSQNNNDADLIKKDAQTFNDMTMEQYALYYTNLLSGCMASYSLADYQYNHGTIDLQTKNSLQNSIKANMELYTKKATAVAAAYQNTKNKIDNLVVAQVTVNGKTTSMFSTGDAWAFVSKNGGTMKLMQDWKSDNFAADTYYYKDGSSFKNGALYVNGKDVTLDLNGHSIIHTSQQKYDIQSEKSNLSVIDSTNNHGAINGVTISGGTLKLNSITVRDSKDAGLRADKTKLDIKNTVFKNNANSAIITEENANGTISSSTFSGNRQTALFNKDSSLTVSSSVFENNSGTKGGAIYNHESIEVKDCTFRNNSASYGGAIFTDNKTTVSNSAITDNTASSNGGGIYAGYRGRGNSTDLNINSTKLTGNSAGGEGGGIWNDSMSYLNMKDVEITNNTAVTNGGGLYAQKGSASSCDPQISGKITIMDNTLTNNTRSNAFLGENNTSKCIFNNFKKLDTSSRIGITSPTSDKTLDVVKTNIKDVYDNATNIFSYDNSSYRLNRYTHWYSDSYWVEIVKN